MHIVVKAPHLVAEGPVPEDSVPINLTVGMVQKCTMALDHWFTTAQRAGSQAARHPTFQQTTPPASHQRRKQPRDADDATTGTSTPPTAQLPTPISGRVATQPTNRIPQETGPVT